MCFLGILLGHTIPIFNWHFEEYNPFLTLNCVINGLLSFTTAMETSARIKGLLWK